MSDETEMNPELESFAASLRQVEAPAATIDRDQLMYDAGWAAAKATDVQSIPNAKVTTGRSNSWRSIALSFASGIVVAASVLLSVVPFSDGSAVDVSSTNQIATATPEKVEIERSNEPDLLAWIENVPPGHNLASGFSSRSVSPTLTRTGNTPTLLLNRNRRQPTTQRLMQELIPGSRPRRAMTWTAWVPNGL